jgi:hypothetical protein
MLRLALLLVVVFTVTNCGGAPTTPCTNEAQDPTGICASSHSHVGGG